MKTKFKSQILLATSSAGTRKQMGSHSGMDGDNQVCYRRITLDTVADGAGQSELDSRLGGSCDADAFGTDVFRAIGSICKDRACP